MLNSRSDAGGRTLIVVPPLPLNDPLYLSVNEDFMNLLQNVRYQLDQLTVEMCLGACNDAGHSFRMLVRREETTSLTLHASRG